MVLIPINVQSRWTSGGWRRMTNQLDYLKYHKIDMSSSNHCQPVHKVLIFKQQIILKALILLGGLTMRLAIWSWFTKFIKVSTHKGFWFYGIACSRASVRKRHPEAPLAQAISQTNHHTSHKPQQKMKLMCRRRSGFMPSYIRAFQRSLTICTGFSVLCMAKKKPCGKADLATSCYVITVLW